MARLEYVCAAEKMTADPEALRIIAKSARGGLRDALTLLEQNMIDGEISTEHVRHTLSLLEESLIDGCIHAMRDADIETITDLIANIRERHIEAR